MSGAAAVPLANEEFKTGLGRYDGAVSGVSGAWGGAGWGKTERWVLELA